MRLILCLFATDLKRLQIRFKQQNNLLMKKYNRKISNFIKTTFHILENPTFGNIIAWEQSGNQFQILNIQEFQSQILPLFFKHSKISSFIRQLNMYGFRKARKEIGNLKFNHPYFLQGRPQLLQTIARRSKKLVKRQADDDKQLDSSYQIENMKNLEYEIQMEECNFQQKVVEPRSLGDSTGSGTCSPSPHQSTSFVFTFSGISFNFIRPLSEQKPIVFSQSLILDDPTETIGRRQKYQEDDDIISINQKLEEWRNDSAHLLEKQDDFVW